MHDAPDGIRAGVRRLFRLGLRRREVLREQLDDELRFHVDARVEQLTALGMTPDAAMQEALRRMGGPIDQVRDILYHSAERREQRMASREWWSDLRQDIRYAARGLRRTPGFTVIAILTLAVGIGANTALFSAIDAMLWRSLPFREPGRLMDIVLQGPVDPATHASHSDAWSHRKYRLFRDQQQSYSALALHVRRDFVIGGTEPERVSGELVTSQYLATLGIPVVLGHDFPDDAAAAPGTPHTVVIGDALWQRRFNADPAVVGKTLEINGAAYEVIGVVPSAFHGVSGRGDFFIPVTSVMAPDDYTNSWSLEYSLIGRLKPQVTPGQAAAEAAMLGGRIYAATPMDKNSVSTGSGGAWSAAARPLNSIRIASVLRRSLLVLFGAVGMVLLIACVNLANLLLGRAAARKHEIAIRLAIGARRGRLVRLLLTESLMLAGAGGVASVAVAWWGSRLLSALNPQETLQVQGLDSNVGAVSFANIHLDPRALVFTFVVTLVVGLVFGLVPAWQATRPRVADTLKDGNAASRQRGVQIGFSRRTLVVTEVALALVLLAGSGLMLRSLANTLAIDPGFKSDHLLTLRLSVPPGVIAPDSMPGFYDVLQARMAGIPGVEEVALTDCPPLSGGCNGTILTFPDKPQSATNNAMVGVHWVSPSWFHALHIPLKKGRMFEASDRLGAPKVVLINEAAARKFFPNEDPIGRQVAVWQGGFHTGATVIGVVGDVRYGVIDSVPVPDAFISYNQARISRMMVFLRTRGEPTGVISAARAAVREVGPRDPVYDVQTMAARVGAASAQARFSAVLLGLFAAMALTLAGMGIYGVMAFGVTQRTREIGIRMALGANQQSVVAMILLQAAVMSVVGVVIGLVAALGATRVLRTLLFDVTPSDPLTYAAIVVVIAGASLLAAWLPARRAARVNPTEALRRG